VHKKEKKMCRQNRIYRPSKKKIKQKTIRQITNLRTGMGEIKKKTEYVNECEEEEKQEGEKKKKKRRKEEKKKKEKRRGGGGGKRG
jgi:hypothetical protein